MSDITTYYRTVFTIEVLSTSPVDHMELSEIAEATMDGDCSGFMQETIVEEVTEEKMAQLLIAQGSDPSFLIYDFDDEEFEEE